MTEYKDMTLVDFANLARHSSPELGSLGKGWLVNYDTGKQSDIAGDEDTAIFLASAREMVLELVKRLQAVEDLDAPIPDMSTASVMVVAKITSITEDKSFTAHDDAVSDGCIDCGNEWVSLNYHGRCSYCQMVSEG